MYPNEDYLFDLSFQQFEIYKHLGCEYYDKKLINLLYLYFHYSETKKFSN